MVTRLQGAILAAGRGERLRKGVDDLPKPLVSIGGVPLIVRQARALMSANVEGIVAVINSETAAAMDKISLEMPQDVRVVVRDTANSMETLFAIGEHLHLGHFLMTTVDTVMPAAEFSQFVNSALRMLNSHADGIDGVIGVVRWRGDKKPLFAKVSPYGIISELGDSQTPLVTAGVYLLNTRIFDYRELAGRNGLEAMRRFLALLIDEGMKLGAVEIASSVDIDEPDDLNAAEAVIGERK